MPRTLRAAATPPLPRTHDRLPAPERMAAAEWPTCASAHIGAPQICIERHKHAMTEVEPVNGAVRGHAPDSLPRRMARVSVPHVPAAVV